MMGTLQRTAHRRFREPRRSSTSFFPSSLDRAAEHAKSQLSGLEQEKAGLSGTFFSLLDRRLDNGQPDAKACSTVVFVNLFLLSSFPHIPRLTAGKNDIGI